ncbi:hypothetical protein [Rhizobium grahamii]|uniref:Uncharacterized protein n=1 Tax=Rhizobium grahamii CCGE 502 TaxID=990285 RepID=S3HE02_9HYPH|nr:hypothetical protein [Rhizobium grahamii]EPE97062.1 hypothetical protein RGCCGE502_16900 [Rhizobium grahamii CCGE 502]
MSTTAGLIFAAVISIIASSAFAHGGGGGKWRNMDCATLALQERNVIGGKLPSKDIKHREKLKAEDGEKRLHG